jgi:hypothetical protein
VANVLSFRAAPQNHISLGEIVSWVEKAVGGASQSWLPPRFYAALKPAEGRLRAEKPAPQNHGNQSPEAMARKPSDTPLSISLNS